MALYGWVIVIFLFAFVLVCGLPWVAFPVLLFLAFLASGGRNFPKVFFKTLPRDVRGFYRFGKILMYCRTQARGNRTVSDIFQDTVSRHPNKTAFIFEERTWTFQEVEEYSNKIANYFQSLGYEKGDTVALFMESCPEYVCVWLGLSKLGVTTALINFNLRLDSLVHCISVGKSRALIFGTELSEAVKDIKDMLPGDTQLFAKGSNYDMIIQAEHLDRFLNECSPSPPITTHPKVFTDMLVYIYTSGTTGLPKAAIMRNSRFVTMGYGIHVAMNITGSDIIYCALPLYHSAGGVIGLAACLLLGATFVIRRKFSASRFWDECTQHKATVVQYIGELCRYLLAQPRRPSDTQHCVQVALGNGLKPQIWKEFQSRFNIQRIAEFYGSTEGNIGLLNIEGTPGSCGFLSVIFPSAFPVRIVKVDEDTGDIVRGPDGRAIEIGPGEVGQPVGMVDKSGGDPMRRFDGYVNQRETSKKLAHDVFKKDDSVFLSGDLLLKDEYGNLYFKDRTGDTFRWRGENVSTTEVEDLISKMLALKDVVVYGVAVPGTEGKAGMAAIVDPDHLIDLSGLAVDLKKLLPSYARPVFLRIVHDLDLTGTFKLQKVKLRKEGFDVGRVKDRLYYHDPRLGQYVPINQETYDEIMCGKIRL